MSLASTGHGEPSRARSIPDVWPNKRLRYLVEVNPTKSELRALPENTEVSFVPMEAVGELGGLDLSATRPIGDVLNGYTNFRNGDVLVAKITPCFENGKGALAAGLCGGIGFGTTELHVIRPGAQIDKRFLFYVTMSDHFRRMGASTMYGAGGQKRVPDEFIEDLVHPIPDLETQSLTADFLDRETAKIDALIDKKQRLLELLEEKRTALIAQAVTKGLDPDVEVRDSGAEWLGSIPGHWDAVQLKYLADLQTGLTLGQRRDAEGLVSRPYLRVANVQAGYLNLEEIAEVEIPSYQAARYELRAGDVLMTEGGDFDKLGRGCVWEGQIASCLHQNHIFAVRPDQDVLEPRFLATVLEGAYGRRYFTATAKQSTNLASTNSTKVRNFPIAVPPLAEQQEILRYLNGALEQAAKLRELSTRGIATLQEYRTALISAAVTGRIDVRETAA